MIRSLLAVMSAAALALTAGIALGQDKKMGGQVGEMTLTPADVGLFKKPSYSPYSGRRFPTQVLWGDTHLHTSNSLDARAFGVTLDPEQAYRFARGEEVTSSHGMRLNSPLKKAPLTGFHPIAKHNAAKVVSPFSETMTTI